MSKNKPDKIDNDKPIEPGRFAYDGLERVIHEKARLGIMSSLATHPDGLLFNDLKDLCALTDGNLSRQLQMLKEAALVDIEKGTSGNRPQTIEHLGIVPTARQYLRVGVHRVLRARHLAVGHRAHRGPHLHLHVALDQRERRPLVLDTERVGPEQEEWLADLREAFEEVERVRAQHPFELEEIDVSLDPALHGEYGERIPVLTLDGEELFELHVDASELARRLQSSQ